MRRAGRFGLPCRPRCSRAASIRGETFQVSLADLDGVIGGHDAASPQLLVVLSGRVRCSTRDEEVELDEGEAVAWREGEWHETRSLEASRVLLIEGAFE